MRTLSLVLLSLAVASCSKEAEPEPAPTLDPPPVGEGFQLQMSGLAPAYTEVWLCEVYDIPIDSTAPVNWV